MAITNQERVGKVMELLRAGLAPFVEREFKSSYHTKAGEVAVKQLLEDFARYLYLPRVAGPGVLLQAVRD